MKSWTYLFAVLMLPGASPASAAAPVVEGVFTGRAGSDDFDDLLGIRDEGGGAVEFRFRVEGLRFVGTDGPDQLYLGTATWSLSVAGGLSRTGAAGMGMAAHADEFREYARFGFNLGETGLNGLTFSVSSSVPGLIGGPLRYPTISYDRATAPPTTLGYAQFNAFSPCRYQGEPNCPGEFDFRSEYMIFAASSLTTRVIGTIPDPDPAAVPEPGTWAMMMLGFGLTGAAARRRWTGATA